MFIEAMAQSCGDAGLATALNLESSVGINRYQSVSSRRHETVRP
jgi:hypothetical protein